MTLPFPFDAVENFFNDLFNRIYNEIVSMPSRIIAALSGIANAVTNAIGPFFSQLQGAIYQQLLNIKDQILGAFAGVPQAVNSLLGGIEAGLAPILNAIVSDVMHIAGDIYGRIAAFVSPIFTGIQNNLTNFINTIVKDLAGVGASIYQYLAPAVGRVESFVTNIPAYITQAKVDLEQAGAATSNYLKANIDGAVSYISLNLAKFSQQLNTLEKGISGAAAGFGDLFKPLTELPAEIWNEGGKIASGIYNVTLKPVIDGIFQQAHAFRGQLTNLFAPKSPLDPNQVIAITSTLGAAASTILAARWGINVLGKVLTIGQMSALQNDFSELLASLGVIGIGEKFNMAPVNFGVMPFVERGWRAIFRPTLLSEGELFGILDRANPDFVKLEKAPPIAQKILAELGHPDEAIDQLWTSHYAPLGIGQVSDAFFRGFINEDKLDTYLQILSMRPDDRELFKKIIYQLPGIRQATQLAKLGLLSGDMIHDLASASGFRKDFADAFVAALQEPNILAVLTKIEGTAISAYEDELINDSDFVDLMRQARKPDNIIASELKLAQFKRTLAIKKFQIQTVEQAMLRGILTFEQGREELQKLSVEPDRIGVIIARAQYLGKIKGAKGTDIKGKQLSVAQITKAVKVGALSLEDGFNAVQARGYDSNDTKVLFELALGVTA